MAKRNEHIILDKIKLEPKLFYSLLINYGHNFQNKYINYFTKDDVQKNQLSNNELQDIDRLYTIFKNIENLDISIEPYIILILSLENFEINNLLRYFIIKWNTLIDNQIENSFGYTLEDFSKISKKHTLQEFLNIIKTFIQNDQNKSFFILNALQNYFYPF